MLDARILEFNYKFLQDLERRRKLTTSQIRLISITRGDPKINQGIGKTYTNQYSTLNSIKSSNPVLDLSKIEKSCQFGDYSIIENIYITNDVLPFPNSFHIYNITGVIRVVEDVQLNEYNDSFYLSEIKRFKSTLIQIFSDYIKSWNLFKKFIDECYVEYCYVDPNYDCGPDEPEKPTSTFIYPDLFIDAGPDIVIWWPTWLDLNTGPLDSLITQQGPTHSGSEIHREWIVFDDDSINSLKATIHDDSELFPILERNLVERKFDFDIDITLTMKVTWPWIVAEDSRNVKINYYSKKTIKNLSIECKQIKQLLVDQIEVCSKTFDELESLSAKLEYFYNEWVTCYKKSIKPGKDLEIPNTPILTGNVTCDDLYYSWLELEVDITKLQKQSEKCTTEIDILQAQYDECIDILTELIANIRGSSVTYID